MNLLDEQAPAASHIIGAWTAHDADAAFTMFLPAALLQEDITWPVVMREILLTLARQVLLARRLLLAPDAARVLGP